MRGIDELLLAEADGLNPLRRNLEGIDQRVADGVGPALAQRHAVLAPAGGLHVADDQEVVGQNRSLDERVSNASDRLIGFRPYHGRVGVEGDGDTERRQLLKVRRNWRTLLRR